MTTTTAPATPPQGRASLPLEPARRLSPSPGPDRAWRVTLTVLAAVVLVLALMGLAASSVAGWAMNRGFSEVPATTELGQAESLTLTTDVADIRVIHSDQAEGVAVALVPEGATTVPDEDTRERARVDVQGEPGSPVVEVRQPRTTGPIPWEPDLRDLLVVVPTEHIMELDLSSDVGDVRAQGEFSSLTATSNVGEVLLTAVSAPRGVHIDAEVGDVELELSDPDPASVEITSSVGDVEVRLPMDATGDVTITTDIGNASLTAPGTGRWAVNAASEMGEVRTDPDLTRADGTISGNLTVRASAGDVTLTR